jgi:hypothetical protein
MPRRPLRHVQKIDRCYSGKLDLPVEDGYFGHAVVRDESQKKGYRCHLHLDEGDPNGFDLVLRIIAHVPVHRYQATELLNRDDDFAFAERLGRLHFYFMPRVLGAINDEIALWNREEHAYRTRPSDVLTALSAWDIGQPYRRGWSRVRAHRTEAGLFGASRVVKNALSRDIQVRDRLESLLRAVPYERARVTLFYS